MMNWSSTKQYKLQKYDFCANELNSDTGYVLGKLTSIH